MSRTFGSRVKREHSRAAAFAAAASLPERAGNGATVQVRGRPIHWNLSLFPLVIFVSERYFICLRSIEARTRPCARVGITPSEPSNVFRAGSGKRYSVHS